MDHPERGQEVLLAREIAALGEEGVGERSHGAGGGEGDETDAGTGDPTADRRRGLAPAEPRSASDPEHGEGQHREEDRKSTRLNSSHVRTSYAAFCFKKKRT